MKLKIPPYRIQAGKYFFPAFFFILPLFLSAQQEAPQRILNLLGNLDRVSDEENWNQMDSVTKAKVASAITISRKEFQNSKDSLLKSALLYHSGRLENMRGNYNIAFMDLKNALHYDIANYPALQRLCGLATSRFKQFDSLWIYVNASIGQWKTKCRLDSLNPFQWYHLGLTYALQKECLNIRNDVKIRAAYHKCMELDSSNVLYVYMYAMATPETERLPWLEKALELEENIQIRLAIMDAYRGMDDEHNLLNFLNQSASVYETHYPGETAFLEKLWREMSEMYLKSNDQERSRFCRDKAEYYAARRSK